MSSASERLRPPENSASERLRPPENSASERLRPPENYKMLLSRSIILIMSIASAMFGSFHCVLEVYSGLSTGSTPTTRMYVDPIYIIFASICRTRLQFNLSEVLLEYSCT